MVEVFKTDVRKTGEAKRLINLLLQHFPGTLINFDLEDCDKVLRLEGESVLPGKVELLVTERGFSCKALE